MRPQRRGGIVGPLSLTLEATTKPHREIVNLKLKFRELRPWSFEPGRPSCSTAPAGISWYRLHSYRLEKIPWYISDYLENPQVGWETLQNKSRCAQTEAELVAQFRWVAVDTLLTIAGLESRCSSPICRDPCREC